MYYYQYYSHLLHYTTVGSSLPCVKPEELTLLIDEWRVYVETDIPQEWVQKEHLSELINTGIKFYS